jgi:diguanylate cyclase (GGDEF)-like protein
VIEEPEATDERYARLTKERDLVRDAARVLSGDLPLAELFERLARLLVAFPGASSVVFAVGDAVAARIEYVFRDGAGGPAEDDAIAPDSPAAAIFRGGTGVIRKESGHHASSEAWVAVPFGGRTVGALGLISQPGVRYDEADAEAVETLALELGARIHAERERQSGALFRQLAITDALTGLGNRRAFDVALAREWRRGSRTGAPISLAILDVDYFKRYNDAYGHVAGDTALQAIAHVVESCANRPGDVATRYGGEEFAVILPECDAEGSIHIAQALCDAVRERALPHDGSSLGVVTVSVGVATEIPDAGRDAQGLLHMADASLYEAKRAGRNRVVAVGGYRSDAPEVHPRGVVRDNVPRFLTPVIGREREVIEIETFLTKKQIVSVVGPGGIGKTRVAVEVAERMLPSFPDGVWFVDLVPIVDPSLVAVTATSAIGVKLPPNRDPTAALAGALKTQRMLLVLDNCEHVVHAAAEFAERVAQECPGVRILTTTREPLDVVGEMTYRLETLDDVTSLELFVSHARHVDGHYVLNEGDEETVREICRRLDGIPLAIELAAARSYAMAPDQLLARLNQRFDLLSSGGRTRLARQQTLRALMDWSYQLLSEDERRLFRLLGVFAGGFTLEAASRVAGESDESIQTLDRLSALCRKSMIAQNEAKRYRILDSMREYAVERLREAGEESAARRMHAQYYALLAHEADDCMGSGSEDAWLVRYLPEVDNFRAALEWALGNDVPLGARLASNLPHFWHYANLDIEGLARASALLAKAREGGCRDEDALRLTLAVAWSARLVFIVDRSLEAAEAALRIAEKIGDAAAAAEARSLIGMALFRLGKSGTRELGAAAEYFRTQDRPLRAAFALTDYAIALQTTNPQRSLALLKEARVLPRASSWSLATMRIDCARADTEFLTGDAAAAVASIRSIIGEYRPRMAPLSLATQLANYASYLGAAGELDEAIAAAREAIDIAAPLGVEMFVAVPVQVLALVRTHRGDVQRAAELLGFVDAAYERIGATRQPTEAMVRKLVLERLRKHCDEATLSRALAAGRDLTMDAARELAFH